MLSGSVGNRFMECAWGVRYVRNLRPSVNMQLNQLHSCVDLLHHASQRSGCPTEWLSLQARVGEGGADQPLEQGVVRSTGGSWTAPGGATPALSDPLCLDICISIYIYMYVLTIYIYI